MPFLSTDAPDSVFDSMASTAYRGTVGSAGQGSVVEFQSASASRDSPSSFVVPTSDLCPDIRESSVFNPAVESPEDQAREEGSYLANDAQVELVPVDNNAQTDLDVESTQGTDSSLDDLRALFEEQELEDHAFDIFEQPEDQTSTDDDTETIPGDGYLSDGAHSSISNSSAQGEAASEFLTLFKQTMRRSVFLGIISLYGKVRYTLEHYEHLVAMLQDNDGQREGTVLPCVTTMRKKVFPRLVDKLFVKSSIETFPMKASFTSYLPTSSQLGTRQSQAVVVLPSSWARMDVRCLHTLRDLVCLANCRCVRRFGTSDLRVDSSNHVIKREKNSMQSDTLWINKNGVPVPSSIGMTVRLHSFDDDVVSNMCSQLSGFTSQVVKYRGENCISFNGELLSTVHVRLSNESDLYLEEGMAPGLLDETTRERYNACLTFLQTLCQNHHDVEVDQNEEDECPGNEQQQTRRERQRSTTNRQYDTRVNSERRYLVPSDHISIFKLGNSTSFGVLVSRFWVQRLDDERNFFMFINENAQGEPVCTSVSTIGAPVFIIDSTLSSSSTSSSNHCRTRGRLADGTSYYMYRLILYADDFTARSNLFPKGSVGGLYLSPSSFHIRSRRSQSSIRTVSLTPAGVSTNSVLNFLIEDLVRGTLEGFDCVDAFGNRVKVFFDVLGFIGDYPAATAVVDLKGHTALAPCGHCGFTLNRSEDQSTYAYTTSIHSCNTSFRRTQDRTTSLRAVQLSPLHLKYLGLSTEQSSEEVQSTSPLLWFVSEHNNALKNSVVDVPFKFHKKDGYQLNLVAPDHLLTGIFKGLLTIVFTQLPNDTERDRVEICLKSALCKYGFQTQTVLYKRKKRKLVPGLSMSVLYCLLTVLPITLESLDLIKDLPSKSMLLNFHRFYCLAFWWPTVDNDGEEAWEFVHGSRMGKYHQTLQVLASNFIKSANKFGRLYPSLGEQVDKPNTHRLLELVYHTIPLFNHIIYVCELVFESSHQPLNFFYQGITH